MQCAIFAKEKKKEGTEQTCPHAAGAEERKKARRWLVYGNGPLGHTERVNRKGSRAGQGNRALPLVFPKADLISLSRAHREGTAAKVQASQTLC